MDLSQRSAEKEIMDESPVCAAQWNLFINDLNWINRYLMGHRYFKRGIATLVNRAPSRSQPLILAELACGGGNILVSMAEWAKKKALDLRFIGYDINPVFIEYAKNKIPNHLPITFEMQDILSHEFSDKTFDILMCNLFCHHLTDEQLIQFFKQVSMQTRLGVIVNDLHRHPLPHFVFSIISRLKGFSPMVHHDGLASIRRSFTKNELSSLLDQAGVNQYTVKWCFPFYYNIVIYSN